MEDTKNRSMSWAVAAILGAIAGGVLVAVATNAIPKMMSQMAEHMQGMMARMKELGFEMPDD